MLTKLIKFHIDIAHTLDTYVLSPDCKDEKTLLRNECVTQLLKKCNFKHVELIKGAYLPNDPNVGCAMTHGIALARRTLDSPTYVLSTFRNLILLENDAVPTQTGPMLVGTPNDVDAIYLGLSTGGLVLNTSKQTHKWGDVYYSDVEDYPDLVRIYNMLSTHAVMICSQRFANAWQLCAVEASLRNVPIDTLIAQIMPYYNVYAVRKPLFYQSAALGGQEQFTKMDSITGIRIKDVDYLPKRLRSVSKPCIVTDLLDKEDERKENIWTKELASSQCVSTSRGSNGQYQTGGTA